MAEGARFCLVLVLFELGADGTVGPGEGGGFGPGDASVLRVVAAG